MDNIDRICRKDFIPTIEDILLVGCRTLGMNNKIVSIDRIIHKFIDIGGTRSGMYYITNTQYFYIINILIFHNRETKMVVLF